MMTMAKAGFWVLMIAMMFVVVTPDELMYVWSSRYDSDACGSEIADIIAADLSDNVSCWPTAFHTSEARLELWGAAQRVDDTTTNVSRVLLSSVHDLLPASDGAACSPILFDTLTEAHVVGVEIYALFAASNEQFSEIGLIARAVRWNEQCSTSKQTRFDGVAINNEFYGSIKCDDTVKEQTWLSNLYLAKLAAKDLPVHLSVGWHWGFCSVSGNIVNTIEWGPQMVDVAAPSPPAVKAASQHMLDIVGSVDIQAAWNVGSTLVDRATTFGSIVGQDYWVLAYLNPNSECRLTFFPDGDDDGVCSTGVKTEVGMRAAFATVKSDLGVDGGLHYYGKVYSAGVPGWPKYDGEHFRTQLETLAAASTAAVELTRKVWLGVCGEGGVDLAPCAHFHANCVSPG